MQVLTLLLFNLLDIDGVLLDDTLTVTSATALLSLSSNHRLLFSHPGFLPLAIVARSYFQSRWWATDTFPSPWAAPGHCLNPSVITVNSRCPVTILYMLLILLKFFIVN